MPARALSFLLFVGLFLPGNDGRAAEQAFARLFCLSLQFQSVTQQFGTETMTLSTASPGNPPNGELAPLFLANQPGYGSSFVLTSPAIGSGIRGQLAIDVPALSDTTGDGFSDFFKVGQAVPATTTSGTFSSEGGILPGTVSADWSRAAGSAAGTCALTLSSPIYGNLGPYDMTFELWDYAGTLDYTGGSTNVDATITLAQSPNLSGVILGPVEFFRSPTNSFNQIILQPGGWTNESGQPLVYAGSVIMRSATAPTNYAGSIVFQDGDPSTPDADYLYWELSIGDPNDSNGNGIPDLTDPVTQPPSPPQLTLASTPAGFVLTLSALVGGQVLVQTTPTLAPAAWTTALSLKMTNSVETIPLPVSGSPQFWRAALSY